jgi:hypothetical protein
MGIFLVNFAKATLVFAAIVALAPVAYPSTISSFSISTTSGDGTPCSMSGSGPGSASCLSTTPTTSHFFPADASASVTLTDNSIQLSVGSFHDSTADAFASITHDDFYSVPVNGPVSALESLSCNLVPPSVGTSGHFSLGSTNVSPPVETIYTGASEGSGPCGPNQIAAAPIFVVSLVATNNIVHLQTNIDASGNVADFSGSIFVQLTVDGFQDQTEIPSVRHCCRSLGPSGRSHWLC